MAEESIEEQSVKQEIVEEGDVKVKKKNIEEEEGFEESIVETEPGSRKRYWRARNANRAGMD